MSAKQEHLKENKRKNQRQEKKHEVKKTKEMLDALVELIKLKLIFGVNLLIL